PRGDRAASGLLDVARDAHLAVPAIRDRADIRTLETVRANDLPAGLDEDGLLVRDLHPVNLGGLKHPSHMIGQPKAHRSPGCLVDADALEYGRPVMQPVAEHMHRRLFPRHEPTVVPYVLT